MATARIDLGNAIVPVQIIYFQQQHSQRNVQVKLGEGGDIGLYIH